MTPMDDTRKLNEISTSLVKKIMLRAPFCQSTFTSNILITLLNVHTRGKQYLLKHSH